MFEVGQLYNRRNDIHDRFEGQRQGGISTPTEHPLIFLFTGESGEAYGYKDGWSDDAFNFVGEGQEGDMEFVRGNRAIRDHLENGKDLLLFQALGKSQPVRYLGCYACASWEFGTGRDVNGDERRIIIFNLAPTETSPIMEFDGIDLSEPETRTLSLEELRERAYRASGTREKQSGKASARQYRKRSKAVHEYVLVRAGGMCECCRSPAPFRKRDKTPYLEPHHTKRLSDDGPDHPKWVGAICPNCHREIHYGTEGKRKNIRLMTHLAAKEAD